MTTHITLQRTLFAACLAFAVTVLPMQTEAATYTQQTAAPKKVQSVSVKVKKQTATVTWKKQSVASKYTVEVFQKKSGKWKKVTTRKTPKGKVEVKKLKAGTYKVRVRALSGETKGKWSVGKTFTIKKQAPATTATTPSATTQDGVVKKSNSGICHGPGTEYYSRTLYFTPYSTLADCLASGGRLPL